MKYTESELTARLISVNRKCWADVILNYNLMREVTQTFNKYVEFDGSITDAEFIELVESVMLEYI